MLYIVSRSRRRILTIHLSERKNSHPTCRFKLNNLPKFYYKYTILIHNYSNTIILLLKIFIVKIINLSLDPPYIK